MSDPQPEAATPPHPRRLTLGEPAEIAPGVFTVVAEPAGVTLGIVAGTEAALVIDTGSAPAQGRELRVLAERLTGLPVRAAVATHAHFDHAFGLAAFADVATYGHESLLETVPGSEAAGPAGAEFGFDPDELVGPNHPLVVAAVVELGERRVEIVHLGRGHTAGDLLVVVPPRAPGDPDLVFAGDLIESAGPPWYGPDSVADEWPATLDGLIGLMTEDTRAVPGHGPAVDRAFVFTQRGQVAAVAGELARIAAEGTGRTDALDPSRWPFPPAHVEAAVDRALAVPPPGSGADDRARRTLPLV
ncbi:glyoxylase-like metal-dependent hydrolase (beta-lactamase superfamily II) [Friedmanniella endophytica]|uniref:Glyoxylase-like metal-dependent hydrolase (Beta-lactamase superfamily II) n=1 Tax=Microlunatus kandeliicorticis TaxID=1759536 RepID=A0A7W3IV67_9ACTN|nr:MBL fold metallo-hydrolase [Microlunatus kandeliicorticis]MBA8795842.1 glyoxylase-like metal-dependent hydrolase (beta-lactamase superfamily II) [Microlunatus kandeliicorticis]